MTVEIEGFGGAKELSSEKLGSVLAGVELGLGREMQQ